MNEISIKNIVYFLNYVTFLGFCSNHIYEILTYLQEHECEYEQTDYVSRLEKLKNIWENIQFQDLDKIIKHYLDKINGINKNNEEYFQVEFKTFLFNKTAELYNIAESYNIGADIIYNNNFMNNNSIFIINLKYNHLYISGMRDVTSIHISKIIDYIHTHETKIKHDKEQINILFERLGQIETFQTKCQKILSKHPRLFMKKYHAYRLHMEQYPGLVERIFKKLLSEKNLSLPTKVHNKMNTRRIRTYGGNKRKSRRVYSEFG